MVDIESTPASLDQPEVSDPSRRRLAMTLLGAVGGGVLLEACEGQAGGPSASDQIDSLGQRVTGTTFAWYDTIFPSSSSTLKGATGSGNQIAIAEGYAAAGDGGGGVFWWDTSPQADDGGTIINPAGGTNPGWRRIYAGPIDVRWFGAKGDGTTNDAPAIQAALDAANARMQSGSPFVHGTGSFTTVEVFLPATAPTVGAVSGKYLIATTLELNQSIRLRGDRGAMLIAAYGASFPLVRCAGYQNVIEGILFAGGKHAIVFFGVWAHYQGNAGSPQFMAINLIKGCEFRFQSGPSIYSDTSVESRPSAAHLVVEDFNFQGPALLFGCWDALTIIKGVGSWDTQSDGIGGAATSPALDSTGKKLSLITTGDSAVVDDLEFSPNTDGSEAWITGTSYLKLRNIRFGGEGGACAVRLRKNITYNGLALPSTGDGQEHALYMENCAVSSVAGFNWLEIYDSFPVVLDVRGSHPAFTGPAAAEKYVSLLGTRGVWIDAGVDMNAVGNRPPHACHIFLEDFPNPSTAYRFRQSNNSASTSGTDVTAYLRQFIRSGENMLTRNELEESGPRNNLWYPGHWDWSQNPTGPAGGGVATGPTDTTTGYALAAIDATIPNAFLGFTINNVDWGSGLAAGEYVFSCWMKANFAAPIYFFLGTRIMADFVTMADQKWHRVWFKFYHDGVGKRFGVNFPGSGYWESGLPRLVHGSPRCTACTLCFFRSTTRSRQPRTSWMRIQFVRPTPLRQSRRPARTKPAISSAIRTPPKWELPVQNTL